MDQMGYNAMLMKISLGHGVEKMHIKLDQFFKNRIHYQILKLFNRLGT